MTRIATTCARAVAALLAAGCSWTIPESKLSLGDRFVLDVAVDDRHDGRFVFDTGASLTVIDAAAAQRWGLHRAAGPPQRATDSTGAVATIDRFAASRELRLGATRFALPPPFVLPVLALPAELNIDGILGTDVMAAVAWIVDVPAGRLHVLDARSLATRLAELYPDLRWRELPLHDENGAWYVDVDLAGPPATRLPLLLDTGADSTSLPAEVVDSLRLPDGGAERQARLDRRAAALRAAFAEQGLTADVRITAGTNRGVLAEAPNTTWHLLRGLCIGDHASPELLIHTSHGRRGLLGADVLGQMVWALDGPARRLLVPVR